MNREDIIRMAQEAGFLPQANPVMPQLLEIFANLVASAEREACAKVCDDHCGWTPRMIGSTIRARGNVATNDTSQERVDETTKQRHDNPPQRTWVGLTDEERNNLWREVVGWGDPSHDDEDLMKAIEAKLKEKNT